MMLDFIREESIDQSINLERIGKEFLEKYKAQKKKPK